MPTDTTEKGLETLIMRHLTGDAGWDVFAGRVDETPEDIAAQVAADVTYRNAKETPRTRRVWPTTRRWGRSCSSCSKKTRKVYKQFVENESFRRFVSDMVYELTAGAAA